MNTRQALATWRKFAEVQTVQYRGKQYTWAEYITSSTVARSGDEVTLVQPFVFPRFAETFLGFVAGRNLAPEQIGVEGKPDFTPADAITHPFVFETKPTSDRPPFANHHDQILRYLAEGRPRIREVVVTNMASVCFFRLEDDGTLGHDANEDIDLVSLLQGAIELQADAGNARRFARFLDNYRWQDLSASEKLVAVRSQQPWNPALEVTHPEWVSRRLDAAVQRLAADAISQIANDALTGPRVSQARRSQIVDELRDLEERLGGAPEGRSLEEFLSAVTDSDAGRALRQYAAHTAYFATIRLLVVRIWEDLNLVEPALYDGGFDKWMNLFDGVLRRVVDFSFAEAKRRYPSLYAGGETNYSWFEPSDEATTDVLYELSNTYLGSVDSDILGIVYERVLERVDRKKIGQFYTPRDIIRFIWDLVDLEMLADDAERQNRGTRVFDIATGSGGFLVEAARRLRERATAAHDAGADLDLGQEVANIAQGLVGSEIQRFSAYLAEVNLLVQVGYLLARAPDAAIPPLGVLCIDSMRLHEPDRRRLAVDERGTADTAITHHAVDAEARIRDVGLADFEMDAAVGNPPYVGEKSAADVLSRARDQMPYWEQFSGARLDLLYWFLILGVSKLRKDGRFGYITSEYWLRSTGATATRQYLAERCNVEHIVLFRAMKPFPDAPGHDSMVIVGTRRANPDHSFEPENAAIPSHKPRISIYEGPNLTEEERRPLLDAIVTGRKRKDLRSFVASVSPNDLGGESWGNLLLTRKQYKRRRELAERDRVEISISQGVLATPVRLTPKLELHMTATNLSAVGGRGSKSGIFVLTSDEVDALGPLNDREKAIVRPQVNTVDLLPYAAVLPPRPDHLIYLHRDRRETGSRTLDEVQRTPIPDGMPTLTAHFNRFEPALLETVRGYGAQRPWWEVHRSRPAIGARISDEMGKVRRWSQFGLVPRWGPGGRLVASLSPGGALPASGLLALMSDTVPAAYLVAMINSSYGQEIAEQVPPGVMQQEILEQFPLLSLPEMVASINRSSLALAQHVADHVEALNDSWPQLRPTLESDIALNEAPDGMWCPVGGLPSRWGRLDQVRWVDSIDTQGAQSGRLVEVSIERDEGLLATGPVVVGRDVLGRECRVRIVEDATLARALADQLAGLVHSRGKLKEVPGLSVSTDAAGHVAAWTKDHDRLQAWIARYRDLRTTIDDAIGA